MENLYLSLAGPIGAGKTTLATKLGAALNLPVYHESLANDPILSDYYQDMPRNAFALQIHLLNRRFEQQQQIIWSKKGGVQDRTIYEDPVFAKMLCDTGILSERDYQIYLRIFNNMKSFMVHPNIIVHLDLTPEQSLERIRKRGLPSEQGITLEYLQRLGLAYEDFLLEVSKTVPVIRVDWSTFQDTNLVVDKIIEARAKIHNVFRVSF